VDEVDDEDFPAPENTPGQAVSRLARAQLDRWLREQEGRPGWFELWEELRAERAPVVGPDGELALNERGQVRTRRRWDWRKALYIAWSSLPRSQRQPPTLEGLCDLLGLRSSGTIRNWRRKDPMIEERVAGLPRQMLLGHVAGVYQALVEVATQADPRAFQDRRLFLEITGEYRPRGALTLAGEDGEPVVAQTVNVDVSGLTDEQLDALAGLAERFGDATGGAGAAAAD